MLPAQPPNSRRRLGTRNDTFRMCNCCGRIWSAKRPGKVAMLSNASDPQMRVAIEAPCDAPNGAAVSGVEDLDGVAANAKGAGIEHDLQPRFGARWQHAGRAEVARRERTSRHEATVAVGQAQIDRRHGE